MVRKGKGGEMVLFHLVSVEAGGGRGERASLPVAWFLSSLEHVPDLKVLSSLIQGSVSGAIGLAGTSGCVPPYHHHCFKELLAFFVF